MATSPPPAPGSTPTRRAFDLIRQHAPAEPAGFWRFCTGAIARHAPADGRARRRFISDMNVALHSLYAAKFDAPDDTAVAARIRDCLFIVEAVAQLRARDPQ